VITIVKANSIFCKFCFELNKKKDKMNFKWTVTYLVIIMALIFTTQAGKHDKKNDHKHKHSTQNKENNHHKNSTMGGHDAKNHTSIHADHQPANQNTQFLQNEQNHGSHQNAPPSPGWSLDNNQAQHHHNNPNGYAMQHHGNSGHQGTMHSSHPSANAASPQPQEQGSNFGSMAMGGVGGLAAGAVGGN
jgi:hypothetical protein